MVSKIIKRITGIGVIGLVGVLSVGTILNTVMSVKAEDTLFGIESLTQEVQMRETPYRILELVPDERSAEIGYYIPGYEPALSTRQMGSGVWADWEEGLKQIRTAKERSEYMEGLNAALQEFYALRGFSTDNVPVTYQGYTESEEALDGYTELAFDTDIRKGYFRPYTGADDVERYTLDFSYVGNYDESDVTGNITTQYYYVKDAVSITFAMFNSLTDDTVLYQFTSQQGADRFEKAGTWGELKDTIEGNTVSGGDGGESVSDGDAGFTGYYKVEIERWQQGIKPAYSALYAVQTITRSDVGDFEFVETEDGYDNSFDTNTVYYKGGFVNQEWFHTKVLNMQQGETEAFPIEVITLTVSELNAMTELPAFDMLYLNSGMQSFSDSEEIMPYFPEGSNWGGGMAPSGNDISENMRLKLFENVIAGGKPCIVDAAILYTTDEQGEIGVNGTLWDTSIFRLAAMFTQNSPMKYYTDTIMNHEEEPEITALLSNIVTDRDKNFVVEQTYCFYAPMALISPDFSVYNIYRDGQEVTAVDAEGFQDVLDEILSENLNRAADSSNEYAPLPTDVSRATAVRHVINYSYRRQIDVKESVRVLEIQPAKSDEGSYELTEEDIRNWAPQVKTVQIDRMTTAEFIGKIEDINEVYDLVYIGTDRDHLNVVTGTKTTSNIATNLQNGGFENGMDSWSGGTASTTTEPEYVKSGNSALKLSAGIVKQFVELEAGGQYTVTAYGRVGGENTRGTFGIDLASGGSDDDIIGKAGEVEFTTDTYTRKSFTFTAVEGTTHLMVYAWTGVDNLYLDDVTLTKTGTTDSATAKGSTVFNDSAMDGLIYFHTGDLRYTAMELAGQLDTEYVNGDRTDNVYYYNPVRYGGNDITAEKKEALLSFLAASYPIIVSDEVFESAATVYQHAGYAGYSVNLQPGSYTLSDLNALGIKNDDISSIKVSEGYQVSIYQDDYYGGASAVFTQNVSFENSEWNDRMSSVKVEEIQGQELLRTRKIDADHIDNSSFMYEFIEAAMGKTNFYARSDMRPDSPMFQFYLNRPKVSLDKVTANGTDSQVGIIEINPEANDRYVLEYKFTIRNEGAASADTLYECELFIDVNADGKYSDSERLDDVTITQNGKTVNAKNLYADREYVLRRIVPDGYKGVLPWKLQISQKNNEHIHNGVTGYTKLKGLERETLKILQICRDPVLDRDWWGGAYEDLFNLEAKIADPTDIYHVLIYGGTYDGVTYPGIYKNFEIDVDFMKISEFEAAYAENNNLLKDNKYNMLILGFSDAYGNISGNAQEGPLGAIIDFIDSGKSVLFAHDTVSYFNYEQKRIDENGEIVDRVGVTSHSDTSQTKLTDQYHNSYNLSRHIRGLVGMDHYGITTSTYSDVSAALKSGVGLDSGMEVWTNLLKLGKDIAYVPKSGKTRSTGLTQGYTYSIINAKDQNASWGRHETFTADQTGNGEFTNQYLNLNYGTVYYHDDSADDGEIKDNYNGDVTNLWVTKVNSGQITDYPYKLADEFMVSNTHNQYYQLDFTADDDKDGQSDVVVWYCLGYRTNAGGVKQETIYSASPNDVSNNYYIYNKGNITYTGVGHAGNNSTVEEAKLFINTMIASYDAGIKDPSVSILSGGTGNAREISSFDSYYDESNNLYFDDSEMIQSDQEGKEKLYFTVSDPNFVKGDRKISIRCYYNSQDADAQEIVYEGKTVKVKDLPMEVYRVANNQRVEDTNNLVSGEIYYILFDNDLMADFEMKFSVYFEVQSTITTYKNTYKTGKSYNRFDYTRVRLFDLE